MKGFILFILLFSQTTLASLTLVSDLDDTIKITHSGNEVDGTLHALFTKNVFTGIPGFLKATEDYADEFHILSASPSIIHKAVIKTLKHHDISYTSLILRSKISSKGKLKFKVKQLKRLLGKNASDDFIFFGDDVGDDPEAYETIRRLYPHRVLASYIHVINGRKLPSWSIKYWTTYDLYLREYVAGRMGHSRVQAGIMTVLREKNMKLIFPHFADCPKEQSTWDWQLRTAFAAESLNHAIKMAAHCRLTRSGF